jgi:hypothetical protein
MSYSASPSPDGLSYLGADPIDEIYASERRQQKQADQEQLRSLPGRVGRFLLDHKYWILGGLAAVGLVMVNWPADPEKWRPDFDFDDAPRKRPRRPPPVRSYAALGASSAMRESALRTIKAQREYAKWLKKLSPAKRLAVSKGSFAGRI